MEKNRFIKELNRLLEKVPEHDRREMLYDYEEHFSIGLAEGRSEDELILELGDPSVIARDLLADYRVTKAENDKSIPNMFNAIIAAISLSFFNLVFILGPVLGVFGVYVGLCLTAIAFTLSPLAIFPSIFFNGFEGLPFTFFASLTLCSIGILLSVGMIYVGRYFYNLILRYIKFNIRVIKGGKAV